MTNDATAGVEQVRAMPEHVREAIFLDLIQEVVRVSGGEGLIPISTAGGEYLGTFYPPQAVQHLFDRHGPQLTPEQTAEVQRAIDHPGRTFTLGEFWESLRAEDAGRPTPTAGREIG